MSSTYVIKSNSQIEYDLQRFVTDDFYIKSETAMMSKYELKNQNLVKSSGQFNQDLSTYYGSYIDVDLVGIIDYLIKNYQKRPLAYNFETIYIEVVYRDGLSTYKYRHEIPQYARPLFKGALPILKEICFVHTILLDKKYLDTVHTITLDEKNLGVDHTIKPNEKYLGVDHSYYRYAGYILGAALVGAGLMVAFKPPNKGCNRPYYPY
jgi:hypothetical protein